MDTTLEDMLRAVIKDYCTANNVEAHEVKIYGYFNYASQKVEYAVYSDIRPIGTALYGQQSS